MLEKNKVVVEIPQNLQFRSSDLARILVRRILRNQRMNESEKLLNGFLIALPQNL